MCHGPLGLLTNRCLETLWGYNRDTPPLVCHLDPTRGIRARSLICGLHRPKRMMAYGQDVECPYTFDGTHFVWWKNWMTCNFKSISPQMWWIVDVGFSRALNENNATQAQKKCLHLDCKLLTYFINL